MALVHADRVKETSTTTGTGTYTLAGAATGFQSFAAIGNGNTCLYCAEDGINWEVGVGTYTSAGTTLARTTVLKSSNSNNAVNWAAGTRNVFVTLAADKFTDLVDLFTTRGDLLYRDATVPARLAIGTATKFLGSDGTDPVWQGAYGKLLASGTVSAAATLDIVLTGYTAYRAIKILLTSFLPVTDAVDFYIRFSTDGGSTFNAAASDYSYGSTIGSSISSTVTSMVSSGAAQIALATDLNPAAGTSAIGNGTGEGIDVEITLYDQTNTAKWGRVTWLGTAVDSTATPANAHMIGNGARRTAQDTDAIRFLFSSGNIASGNYAAYGLA